jgi:transposase
MAKTYILKNKMPERVPEALPPVETYEAPPPPEKGRIIGLDCHPDVHAAAVYQGRSVHDARKLAVRDNMSLDTLLQWATREFTREDLFLLEASGNSFEIHGRLLALGLRAVVLESAYVGKHAKTYADNDKMAAGRIALVYLGGKAPCVWVPDATTSERRELLHAHRNVVADHTAAINTLKGYLNKFTIRTGARSLASPRVRKWVFEQRTWSPMQKKLLEGYFANLDAQAQRRAGLEQLICGQICKEHLMLRCMNLLGIGRINAFALLATIGNVRRFERPEKLAAYLGLNPGQRESGNGKRVKVGIGKRGCGTMRHLLVQAAHAVLRTGAKTPLGKWGWKLFGRKGSRNIAVAAIARKLAVQVWHLLMGNPPKALEGGRTLDLKLQRLASRLGEELRAELGLPKKLADCVSALKERITDPPPTPSPV